jgi:hypothetical protein
MANLTNVFDSTNNGIEKNGIFIRLYITKMVLFLTTVIFSQHRIARVWILTFNKINE